VSRSVDDIIDEDCSRDEIGMEGCDGEDVEAKGIGDAEGG
jgi:hypothetical protein